MIYIIISFIAGLFVATQGIINSRLAEHLDSLVIAALFSFFIGSTFLLAISLVLTPSMPSLLITVSTPKWMWFGGIIGAFIVVITAYSIPQIGISKYIFMVVLGQSIGALIYDHLGIGSSIVREMTLERGIGFAMLILGVWIVNK